MKTSSDSIQLEGSKELAALMKVEDFKDGDFSTFIANPPLNRACEFLQDFHSRQADKIALLLQLNFIEVKNHVFDKKGLRTIYVLSNGLAWFVWNRGYFGKPQLEWLNSD